MRNDRTDSPQSHREHRENRLLHPGLVERLGIASCRRIAPKTRIGESFCLLGALCVSVVSHPGLRRFAERVCVHGVPGIGVVGPSTRFALRGRLGRRALRPAAPGTVQHRPARCHRRGGLCRPGDPARADGPARLPADPRRPAPCRGRLPGGLPRAGRKARSIRDPDLLGNWLYGVAPPHGRSAPGSSSPAGAGARRAKL